jgi:hypothetical protein
MSNTSVRIGAHRRSWVRVSVQLLVVGFVVYRYVVPQVSASRDSLHLLFDIDSPWLAVAALAELASLVGFALVTRALLARPTRPAVHHVLRIDLSTIALSHCLPGGGAVGTALGTRLLTRAGVPSAEALFTKLAQGVGSAVILQALLVGALLERLLLPHPKGWEELLVAVEAGALVTLCSAAALVRWARLRRAPRPFSGPRRSLPQAHAGVRWFRSTARHAEQHMASLRGDTTRLAHAAFWVTANWLFDAAALWTALHAYGPPMRIDGVLIAFAIANTVAWLPISPSGLGISDALLIPTLIAFGAGHTDAVLGVITWRLLAFWLPIPLGLASYGSLHLESRRRHFSC